MTLPYSFTANMHRLRLLVLVFVGLAPGLTTPVTVKRSSSSSSNSFSVPVAPKAGASRNFVRDWAAARHRWGHGVPDSVASTFSLADDSGRVNVQPLGSDDIYVASVDVGTPPQSLKIALDTGSSDFWVQSTDTIYQSNRDGPWAPQYKPNSSQTARIVKNALWDVEYVDGTGANGIVYRDTVHMGGFDVPNATIQSAQIVASRFESEVGLTGVMGLAKSLPNNIIPPTPVFLDLLRAQLDKPVFTVDLKRNATGRFEFGYIDRSLASDNLTWLDSDPDSPHWDVDFDLTSWSGNGNVWWAHRFTATIDTGTTLMFLPDTLASMYWFSVPGMRVDPRLSNAYTFECSIADELPDLKFKLRGSQHVITIPGPYLNYGPVDDDPDYCWGGMQSADDLDVTILGDIMLKAIFVAFDLEGNKVGFANKKLEDVK